MELKIPSPEQAYWGLRAMKADSARSCHKRGSEQRLGLLVGHGRAGRGTPNTVQHSSSGNIQTYNS